MTKQEAIDKINKYSRNTLNDLQKKTAIQMIKNCPEERLISNWLDFIDIRVKKGFVFDKSPQIDEGKISLIKYNEKLSIKSKDKNPIDNTLIIGENYDALKNLLVVYRNKIDVIYIDPPYNTGASVKEGNSSSNTTLSYNDKFGRTGWLNIMNDRLKLAKDLLSEKGVIFVSIDDNEQAYLKVLMDEIFKEENYVGEFIRKTKSTTNDAKTGFNMQHEILFLYAKNKSLVNLKGELKDFSNYKNPDNDPNGDWISDNPTTQGKGYYFKIINPETKKEIYPPHNREWVFSEKSFKDMIQKGRIKWTNSGRGFLYKRYKNNLRSKYKLVNSLDFCDNKYMNQAATKELNLIFSDRKKDDIFSYPKGSIFIKDILSIVDNKNAIVLDFFAGSGSTGHSVMQLNKEDNGSRKFILCNNNKDNSAIKHTYERLFRIINGKTTSNSKNFDWIKWIEKNNNISYINNNLNVFELNYYDIKIDSSKNDAFKLSKEISNLKEKAYNQFKIIDNNYNNNFDIYYDLSKLNKLSDEKIWK